MCRITDHAVLRYQQRVGPLDDAAVRAAIRTASEAIDIAADFGAPVVVMGNGARLVLEGDVVATVLGARHRKHQARVRRAPRFEWVG